ncbi:hypothetical protein P3T21_007612 [Paraburkholderia sp. GAS334]
MVTLEEISVVSALAAGGNAASSLAGAHQKYDQIAVSSVI